MDASVSVGTTIYLATRDLARLRDIVATVDHFTIENGAVASLKERIAAAEIRPVGLLPITVATIGSRVRVRYVDHDESMEFTLTFPSDSDDSDRTVSILQPLGAALLGATEGESIAVGINGGTEHVLLEEVIYQPFEAEFDLE